jgi:hypothetical protein
LKRLGLKKNYSPIRSINKIKVEISSSDSNKWTYSVLSESTGFEYGAKDEKAHAATRDSFTLLNLKKKMTMVTVNRFFFGHCEIPLEMDERIIESCLKVLKSNQQSKLMSELEKKEKAHRDKIDRGLEKIDKIERKLEQLSNLC